MGKRIKIDFTFEDSTNTTGKYLVFDLETTGLPNSMNAPPDDFGNWPYIVQIAWMLFDNEQKLKKVNSLYDRYEIFMIPALLVLNGENHLLWKCEDFSSEQSIRAKFEQLFGKAVSDEN